MSRSSVAMSAISRIVPLGLLLCCLDPAFAKSARVKAIVTPSPQDMIEYGLRKGESLFTLAQQSLSRPENYRVVQRINRISDPRRIPVGTVLRIPVDLLRAEPLAARIVAVRGDVAVQQAGQQTTPRVGSELAPGALIETGADGFVTMELPNGSRTSMPTRTRLRITRLHRITLTGSLDYDLAVDGGKVETTASPLGTDRNNRFRIRTPRALAAVRGTRFRVGYGEDTSLAEVLEGTVAASSAAIGTETSLTEGIGAVVSPNGDLGTEHLLAAPDLVQPGRVQTDPMVQLTIVPLSGARGYRLQIAEDAGFTKVLAEQQTDAITFAFANIPNGSLFVRASALAPSGLEGVPQTFAMRRILAGVTASAQVDADTMRFSWGGQGEGRRTYSFQLGPVPDASGKAAAWLINEAGLEGGGVRLRALPAGVYRWRVGLRQEAGGEVVENWLPFEKLTVAAPE
ncbi:MAG: hypothetical protein B7X90_14410 [Novosphingobium sp. 17-62-19]|uniref:FecR domain-containing protein n=1 Tax=Novosphingobium sp. 17-62-19 TaxID=1970406 RepID=UPI000BC48821|nr:FecR domain-containing protein [Novosphingobium sp. 17-62-19]OYX96352.1 MAG: hypothetical protein B7Y74_01580 [Novosphingobium sp. 35-62-5]OZA17629.1 MAG: hypothetical protein B7X90_14410 [Novosphingobium sp. 17-62-19]HQS96191.1 FecR domain-containing protein [Novosphingobium sp.]